MYGTSFSPNTNLSCTEGTAKMEAIRVFVVEDESFIARDVMNSLEQMGYKVTGTAASGADALRMLEQTTPHLVLMDLVLQGDMDGIETAEKVRSRFNIPVIYLTACSDDNVLDRAKLTEPFGYIVKPYEDEELRLAIEMAIYKHQMEDAIRHSREQYRTLLESAGAIPWELNPDTGCFNYMGPQSRTVLGFSPEDISDLGDFIARVPEEQAKRVREFYLRAYKKDESAEIEYPFTTSTGDQVWLRDTGTLSHTADGGHSLRGFILEITRRKLAEDQREMYIAELQQALEKIKALHGMLPICAWCKKIRDDHGYWKQVEIYLEEHSEAEFTHSMCPECKNHMEAELKDIPRGDKKEN